MISVETEIFNLYEFEADNGWIIGGAYQSLLDEDLPLVSLMKRDICVLSPFIGYYAGVAPLVAGGYEDFSTLIGVQPKQLMTLPKIGIRRAHTIVAARDLLISACTLFQEAKLGRKTLIRHPTQALN